MAKATNKQEQKAPAKPKKVFVTVKGEDNKDVKYELLGGPNKQYFFKGVRYTKEDAVKNNDLIESLIATNSPLLEKQ